MVLTAKVLGAGTVYAVDSVEDRLKQAEKMDALPLNLQTDNIDATVKFVTNGRGADAVVESVGNRSAMRLAIDLVRPCGAISSIGFHQTEFPFTAFAAYSKNIEYGPVQQGGLYNANSQFKAQYGASSSAAGIWRSSYGVR